MDASDAPHGLLPMQAAGASNHPISLQPFGQWSLRAVCCVAALANSGAIGRPPRLASHPAKTAARPLGDRKHVLTGGGGLGRPFVANVVRSLRLGAVRSHSLRCDDPASLVNIRQRFCLQVTELRVRYPGPLGAALPGC